jgi:MazG family protein
VVAGGDGLARALVDLQELAEQLRRDCPWDRAQTARTIAPHTVEEAYEVADAALAGDDDKLVDELGDLLFQTVFLSLLLEERGAGDLAAVARGIHEKLVRRHPHVFSSPGELRSPGEVKERWEAIKTGVEGREGIFHHVPDALPALLLAQKVQRRAAVTGFDYPDISGALADVEGELAELRSEASGDELGDVLFACVNVARHLGVDAELELRQASGRFVERVERAAELAATDGKDFAGLALEEQDRYFDRAKESLA